MIPKLLVQRIAPGIVGFLSRTLRQQHQLIWCRHWKLAQHERVHDTEDRRVGSNAQRQREYDYGGEQRRVQQQACVEAYVLDELFQTEPAPCVAGFFFQEGRIAESSLAVLRAFFVALTCGIVS